MAHFNADQCKPIGKNSTTVKVQLCPVIVSLSYQVVPQQKWGAQHKSNLSEMSSKLMGPSSSINSTYPRSHSVIPGQPIDVHSKNFFIQLAIPIPQDVAPMT